MANVEILLKKDGKMISLDIEDFPYRLNRVSFTTSKDKLKTLGGTTSTKIKFSKSKKNNLFFIGKTDFKSIGKFNGLKNFEGVIIEDGAESARGEFKLESVAGDSYEGTFFDNDAGWIDLLSKVKLNELGYINGVPTWLVPFDGPVTFNAVNDLSNRQTDFVCPTVSYNNTPILDYMDFTNFQIFESGLRFPDSFLLKNGLFSSRLGLNFDDFPPAVYYRNIIERVFKEVGLAVDCSLFYEDWFNALILPYTGEKYKYNWKNIASISSNNPFIQQLGEDNFDEIDYVESTINPLDGLALNKSDLPPLGGGAGTTLWITDEVFRFKKARVIQHDDWNGTLVEKISLVNNFNTFNRYEVPEDGNYTIRVNSQIESEFENFIDIYDGPAIWLGATIYNAFGTWDANSNDADIYKNHFGWDDNVLIVLRRNESDDFNYQDTEQSLYEWMNGQNTRFTDNQNDAIAYFSPKRWLVNDTYGGVAANQISGCPMSNFENEVSILNSFVGHQALSVVGNKTSRSWVSIEVNADLKKGEKIEVFWISLANVSGTVALTFGAPPLPISDAADSASIYQRFGSESAVIEEGCNYSVTYNCGQYDLDLAQNLPNISGLDFIASFIKQFNLHFYRENGMINLVPFKQYYSKEVYDITKRVDWSKSWSSNPLETPKRWLVGYNVDTNDRLLVLNQNTCTLQNKQSSTNYGNVLIENENVYSNDEAIDYNIFSSTKFIDASCPVANRFSDAIDLPTETDATTGFVLNTGVRIPDLSLQNQTYVNGLKVPSIQSSNSFSQKTFGALDKSFNYVPRLIYHLGTVNQFVGLDEEYQVMVGYPRVVVDTGFAQDFIRYQKHWCRLTVSQFDGENSAMTGINYPTLRYDSNGGIYQRFFENLVELFNISERLTLYVALRQVDWVNLKGYKKVRFMDQVYRLMDIKDYDPQTRNSCIINLLKEI